eukprot:4253437-Alexandrium_andersonii.AAC.1
MLALSAETAVMSKSPAARNSSSTSTAKASQKGSVTCRRTAHAMSKLRSRRRVRVERPRARRAAAVSPS